MLKPRPAPRGQLSGLFQPSIRPLLENFGVTAQFQGRECTAGSPQTPLGTEVTVFPLGGCFCGEAFAPRLAKRRSPRGSDGETLGALGAAGPMRAVVLFSFIGHPCPATGADPGVGGFCAGDGSRGQCRNTELLSDLLLRGGDSPLLPDRSATADGPTYPRGPACCVRWVVHVGFRASARSGPGGGECSPGPGRKYVHPGEEADTVPVQVAWGAAHCVRGSQLGSARIILLPQLLVR